MIRSRFFFFLIRGLIVANLIVFGTYSSDKDELMILRRRSMTSGSNYFSSLVGIGSDIHVVDLDDLTSLDISSFPFATNDWNFWK